MKEQLEENGISVSPEADPDSPITKDVGNVISILPYLKQVEDLQEPQ